MMILEKLKNMWLRLKGIKPLKPNATRIEIINKLNEIINSM